MDQIYAKFHIPNIALYSDDEGDNAEIKRQVIQALKDRTALFDGLIGLDDNDLSNPADNEVSNQISTMFDVRIPATPDLQIHIDTQPDLPYNLAIAALESGHEVSRNSKRADVSYIGFEEWGM